MSSFGWVSVIISGLCFAWSIGLGIFVIVRAIVLKVRARKEIKKIEKSEQEINKD